VAKLNLPKDENGKIYWIPIVMKNKDYLVGYIEAYKTLSIIYEIPVSELHHTLSSSDRFNDVLQDGTRMRDLSNEELKNKLKEMISVPNKGGHPENDEELYKDIILTIDCVHCNMFYSFKKIEEIPDESLNCSTCGKTLILYTNLNEDEIIYEGGRDQIDKAVKEITKELLKEKEDDDTE
jgi:hypothetical protein